MKMVRWLIPGLFLLAMASLPLLAYLFGMQGILLLILGLIVLVVAALSIRVGIGIRRAAAEKNTRRKIMWLSAAALLAGGFIAALGAISSARSEMLWIKNAAGSPIIVKSVTANGRVLDAAAIPLRIERWDSIASAPERKTFSLSNSTSLAASLSRRCSASFPVTGSSASRTCPSAGSAWIASCA